MFFTSPIYIHTHSAGSLSATRVTPSVILRIPALTYVHQLQPSCCDAFPSMPCPAEPYHYILVALKPFKKWRDLRRKFRRPPSQARQLLKACVNSQQARKERSKLSNRKYMIPEGIHSYTKPFRTVTQVLVQHRRKTKAEEVNSFPPHQWTHTERQNTCQNSHHSDLTRPEKVDLLSHGENRYFATICQRQIVLQVWNHFRLL